MKSTIFFYIMTTISALAFASPYAVIIHGGAGAIPKQYMSTKLEQIYRNKLKEIIETAEQLLKGGGSSDEAVLKAVEMMENSALFNAGKGSVLNSAGQVEMDAGFANSAGKIGGIFGVQRIKNPIHLAYRIAINSAHHYFTREGAEQLAVQYGLNLVDNNYFIVGFRQKQLEKAKKSKGFYLDHSDLPVHLLDSEKFGTVGAVALDQKGNLSAATSTGGLVNKEKGRVGDTPLFGNGTFAHKDTCAISTTGKGEIIIQNMVSAQIHFAMKNGQSLNKAVETVLGQLPKEMTGLIAIDKFGNITSSYNTKGMYRAWASNTTKPEVKIWGY